MSTIENRTSDEPAKTIEIEETIDISNENTNKNGSEQNGAEQPVQLPPKAPTRRSKKPAPSADAAQEAAETAAPKQTTTRRRKTNVELVSSETEATESVEAPRPKRASNRAPKKPVEPVASATETAAIPALETTSLAPANASAAAEPQSALPKEEAPLAQAETHMAAEPTAEEVEPALAAVEPVRVVEEDVTTPVVIVEETPAPVHATERRHLVKSAGLVALGNFGSSALGMVRQIVVTGLGPSIAGPFNAALSPANNFFQLLVNGSVSGALVPTFNSYAEKREELRRIVFTLVNLIFLIAVISSIGYALIAPTFVNFLVAGFKDPADKLLTLQYSQMIFFSLAALGPFAVLLAALFALKEFGWPAFATAAYHVGIILGAAGVALFGSFYLGKMALPIGVLLGALGELALLLPGMRNQHLRYMFVLDLKHPALRHILKLYLPIAISFVFTTALVSLDISLWSLAPGKSTANIVAQITATTLIQFPIGLVGTALSVAVLPTLSEHARAGNHERFKEALLLGFRLGLLLMIPAMVGLWVLRLPIVDLLFAHHNNSLKDADISALALQNYVYQLPFVAIDQLLIAAFYARKNTLIPVIIGIVCIGFYLVVALPFYHTIGVPALAFANTVQNSMHAIILLILLRRVMGALHIRTALPTILKISAAAALMGLVTWGLLVLLAHVPLFSLSHFYGRLLTVIIAGGLAVAVYVGSVLLLKVEEIHLLKGAIMAKLGKR